MREMNSIKCVIWFNSEIESALKPILNPPSYDYPTAETMGNTDSSQLDESAQQTLGSSLTSVVDEAGYTETGALALSPDYQSYSSSRISVDNQPNQASSSLTEYSDSIANVQRTDSQTVSITSIKTEFLSDGSMEPLLSTFTTHTDLLQKSTEDQTTLDPTKPENIFFSESLSVETENMLSSLTQPLSLLEIKAASLLTSTEDQINSMSTESGKVVLSESLSYETVELLSSLTPSLSSFDAQTTLLPGRAEDQISMLSTESIREDPTSIASTELLKMLSTSPPSSSLFDTHISLLQRSMEDQLSMLSTESARETSSESLSYQTGEMLSTVTGTQRSTEADTTVPTRTGYISVEDTSIMVSTQAETQPQTTDIRSEFTSSASTTKTDQLSESIHDATLSTISTVLISTSDAGNTTSSGISTTTMRRSTLLTTTTMRRNDGQLLFIRSLMHHSYCRYREKKCRYGFSSDHIAHVMFFLVTKFYNPSTTMFS